MSAGNLFVTVSEDNLEFYRTKSFAQNSVQGERSVVNKYNTWRNLRMAQGKVYPPLDCCIPSLLNNALRTFFCELKKADGNNFKSDSMGTMYANMNRHLQKIDPQLNLYGPEFRQLFDTANGLIKVLATTEPRGKKQAPEITEEQEKELWDTQIMGLNSPNALINALLWKVGTCFGVRGGEEFRTLRLDNFNICKTGMNTSKIMYIDHHSKSNQSGLCKSNSQSVRGPIVEDINNQNSLFNMLHVYQGKIHPDCDITTSFWFQPVKIIKNSNVWFTKVPMGHNKLDVFVKNMAAQAGFGKFYTNHSMRVTTINRLMDHGVSDADIVKYTGHRTTQTLKTYRRNNDRNATKNSAILAGPSNFDFVFNDKEIDEINKLMQEDDDWNLVDDVNTAETKPDSEPSSSSNVDCNFSIDLTQLLAPTPVSSVNQSTQCDSPPHADQATQTDCLFCCKI